MCEIALDQGNKVWRKESHPKKGNWKKRKYFTKNKKNIKEVISSFELVLKKETI